MPPDSLSTSVDHTTSAHINQASLLGPTVKIWRLFLEDQGVSTHTVKAFQSDLNLLAAFLPPDRTVGEISTHDLNQFLEWLQKGRGVPCSPKTLARRITSLKAFFRWLHQYGALMIDPAEKVPQKTVISPLPTVLTAEEVSRVVAAADKHRKGPKPDTRSLALVTLLLETAIKKGECLGLNLNHLEPDAPGGPILFIRYTNPRNRYKERKIPLSAEWIEIFQEYASQYNLKDQLFPWSQRRLEYLLEGLGQEAGLQKHLSFDMCRWTSVLTDWKAGVEHDKIRQKLGISKIQWREINMKLEQLAKE